MTGLLRVVPGDLASRAAALSFVANLGLMALKLAVGLISGSIAVFSDGIDSGQDVIASAIAFASLRYGRRPPDVTHPYGHGRAETIAAAAQGLLIGAGGIFIFYRSILRLANPPDEIRTELGLISMVIAAVVNLLVISYVRRVARETRSPVIASDARHLWTNVVQAGAILFGLALVASTGEVAFDAIVAILLAAYLLWTAAAILWSTVADVLDVSLSDEEVAFVRESILAERDAIAGYHRLRTRRSGQRPYVEFHLIVNAGLTVAAAHAITERIEATLKSRWPNAVVTIHTEPADGRFLGPLAPNTRSSGREGEYGERQGR